MSMMNPRGMVNRSNQIGRVNEKKNRDFWSNNLPFREANGLAPDLPLQFLWPTGTEAGGYWDFGNSGYQLQTGASGNNFNPDNLTEVGQTIGLQFDRRRQPVAHSLNLSSRALSYGGTGATTISVAADTVTFNNAANGDFVRLAAGLEWPIVEYTGRCEVVYKIENAVGGGQVTCSAGNAGGFVALANGTYIAKTNGAVNGDFFFQVAGSAGPVSCKITVLSITGYPGNHLSQGTAAARPISAIETVGSWNQSVYSGRFDGVDDSIKTPVFAAGTLINGMDFFCAVKRNSAAKGIVAASTMDNFHYFGCYDPAGAGVATMSGAGAATLFVNGVAVADDRKLLSDAIIPGQWAVLEYRNLDLSTFTDIGVSSSPAVGFFMAANAGTVALCPAQSTVNRNLARTLIGASVGLVL
jgi:hypothetical protein